MVSQVDTAQILLDSMSSDEEKELTIAYKRRARLIWEGTSIVGTETSLENSLHLAAGENHLEFVGFLLSIIGPKHKMLIDTNGSGENALMKAANVSALRITKLILEKVKNDNPKFLDIMLRQRSHQGQTALRYAIKSQHYNSRKCAKMIISFYGLLYCYLLTACLV